MMPDKFSIREERERIEASPVVYILSMQRGTAREREKDDKSLSIYSFFFSS
jgi:hypothetical protein